VCFWVLLVGIVITLKQGRNISTPLNLVVIVEMGKALETSMWDLHSSTCCTILWLLGFLYKGVTSVPGGGLLLMKVRNTANECQLLNSIP